MLTHFIILIEIVQTKLLVSQGNDCLVVLINCHLFLFCIFTLVSSQKIQQLCLLKLSTFGNWKATSRLFVVFRAFSVLFLTSFCLVLALFCHILVPVCHILALFVLSWRFFIFFVVSWRFLSCFGAVLSCLGPFCLVLAPFCLVWGLFVLSWHRFVLSWHLFVFFVLSGAFLSCFITFI